MDRLRLDRVQVSLYAAAYEIMYLSYDFGSQKLKAIYLPADLPLVWE